MNLDHLRGILRNSLAELAGTIKRGEPIGNAMSMHAYNIKDSTRILEEDIQKGTGNSETEARLKIINKFSGYIDECLELHRRKARGCGQTDAECDRFIGRINAWA